MNLSNYLLIFSSKQKILKKLTCISRGEKRYTSNNFMDSVSSSELGEATTESELEASQALTVSLLGMMKRNGLFLELNLILQTRLRGVLWEKEYGKWMRKALEGYTGRGTWTVPRGFDKCAFISPAWEKNVFSTLSSVGKWRGKCMFI